MRILKPGEPCPCCGQPIRDDLPRWRLLFLSYIAEGLSLMDAISAMTEVMELPPQGGAEFETTGKQEALAVNSDPPSLIQDDAAKKRAILQRLNDYRKGNGLGCLEKVSEKTAHFKTDRLSAETLRMIITGDVPRMSMDEWEKIARALDALESKNNAPNHT